MDPALPTLRGLGVGPGTGLAAGPRTWPQDPSRAQGGPLDEADRRPGSRTAGAGPSAVPGPVPPLVAGPGGGRPPVPDGVAGDA